MFNIDVFSEYCKIFKNSFFHRAPPVTVSNYNNQLKIFQDKVVSKFHGQHASQFNLCRYEGQSPAAKREIHWECFQWNFAKF